MAGKKYKEMAAMVDEDETDIDNLSDVYHKYRRTHNDGVFAAYTPEIRAAILSALTSSSILPV